MSYHLQRKGLAALGASLCLSALAGPMDNLSSDYQNPVWKHDPNATYRAVQLGAGSGYYFTTNRPIATVRGTFTEVSTFASLKNRLNYFAIPNLQSTVGAPISATPANVFLGEALRPPENWNGQEPVIAQNTGGKAVWIDFAETVLAVEAGPVEVKWPVTTASGGVSYNVEQSVVSASPNKRPVRLYWTHERPDSVGDTSYRALQNAGPTVTFGSNYKVHLFGSSRVGIFDADAGTVGGVRLNGNELEAFEGTSGTFLIVYSRLDEKLNERKMLAYEIVEVMEPSQTQLDVRIGDQLKPQERSFDTEELFPKVSRGLTDESENGEIYVYQHSGGAQNNYLWAIRDSSANPWKIEVFWSAKEELDVVWPFECDIYAASWDETGAQFYVRDTETAEGGEARKEPAVFFPSGVTVEAMDYQVVAGDRPGETKIQKHMHVMEDGLYTDWADRSTYALLKYASGDTVWFQTVRSLPAKDTPLLASLSLDFAGALTNVAFRTGTFEDGQADSGASTNVALAAEIRAPFAAEDGFFYPGWIQRDHDISKAAYPVRNPYNVAVYGYPTEFTATNALSAPIFPVNMGELEVWWSLPSNLMGKPRETGGNPDALAADVYFPAIPVTYRVQTPEQIGALKGENEIPQIVIASCRGSDSTALCDHLEGGELETAEVIMYNPDPSAASDLVTLEAKLGVQNNTEGVVSNFTFETRLRYPGSASPDFTQEIPLLSVYGRGEDGSRSAAPYLRIGTTYSGHFFLNGVDVSGGPAGLPDALTEFSARREGEAYSRRAHGMHLAFVHAPGTWTFYVNGHLVGTYADAANAAIDVANDTVSLFDIRGGRAYQGPVHYARLWSESRTFRELYQNRYAKCGAQSKLVFQFYGPTQEYDDFGNEENLTGPVSENRLTDSSGHEAHARIVYAAEVGGRDTSTWLRAGRFVNGVDLRMPHLGRTFPGNATLYRQNDPELDGYNPNEEHALVIGGIAYALRCDLNCVDPQGKEDKRFTSLPYVLVQYADSDSGRPRMCALRVVPENDVHRFVAFLDAGSMIQAPAPMTSIPPTVTFFRGGPLYGATDKCFVDRKGNYWAHQAGDDGGSTNYVFEFAYPMQPSFDLPNDNTTSLVGLPLSWMGFYRQRDDYYVWSLDRRVAAGALAFQARDVAKDPAESGIDFTYVVDWPESVPKLYVNDTLHDAKDGLPAVRGQLSVKIAYDQSVAASASGEPSAQLIDPETPRYASLKVIPGDIRNYRDPKTSKRHFTDVPPFFRDRFAWDPNAYYNATDVGANVGDDTREISLSGKYFADGDLKFAWLNTMDAVTKQRFKNADYIPGADDPDWGSMIDSLPSDPVVLTDDVTPFDAIALATTGRGSGYVTLVFNDSTNLSMVAKSEVITMSVIKIEPELYNGQICVVKSDNPLDKQLNMKYSSDFGGHPERWEFRWQHALTDPTTGEAPADQSDGSTAWSEFTSVLAPGYNLDFITVGDAGSFGLADRWIRCKYRSLDPDCVCTNWSNWSKPQLAESWIKRVLKAINPFDQRIRDFLNNKVDTQLTMIQQAGAPYDGDIPLNMEAVSENGLIQIYETLLHQARKLSIDDESQGPALVQLSLSLQMAAGRIAELYTMLGNEAYADALNPTVDLGSGSGVDDTAESSVFPFMNQCENLLDEELALLRGRDLSSGYQTSWDCDNTPWSSPVYNRLMWNFSMDIMGGQLAYVENYGIRDLRGAPEAKDPKAKDGVIDAYDAETLYPQGHGDAWGHYLSAVKGYYALLRHKNFTWLPQLEGVLAGQTSITVGMLHEKRFAQAAEMKAKAGEKIVADTYRQRYAAGGDDTWLEAEDDVTWTDRDGKAVSRAWGVDDWATRAHLGAFYDWATANTLLPARNAEEGQIRMLDRESTKEIGAIAASAQRIQSTADYADAGLNPLGISDSAIPFDISPREIDAGKTHFEQVYERAKKAARTAKEIFNRVKGVAGRLRDQNASGDYDKMVEDEEAALERRLIEIYGYPYSDDIGAGKTYPTGYTGPDTEHYYYVETYDLDGSGGLNGAYRGVSAGDGSYGRYIDVTVDDYRLVTTNITGTFQAEIDQSLADNGFLGNIIVGAVSWYQDKLAQLGSYIDPLSKYTGICATNFSLPVAVVDTTGDALDGKVDYTFSVAAWSNAQWVASYFVGEDGFTPKPPNFHGQRKAEGETQIALNGYAAQLAEIDVAANRLFAANEKLQGLIDELTTLDYTTQMGYVTDAAKKEVENFIAACKKNAETVEATLKKLKEFKDTLCESGVEAFPKLTGLSFDLTSVGRAALLAVKSGVNDLMNGQLLDAVSKIGKCEEAVEELDDTLNQQFATWMANADRQKKIAGIKEQAAAVKAALGELEVAFTTANETRMKYAKIVAEGDQLQVERERLRIQWAADLSQSRYRNMMFQVMRNDELTRYNQAFELAAKYVFLAAKAYDYETGLLRSDRENTAGSEFMSAIVKARALGRFTADGEPLGGGSAGDPGLADILFRMAENWDVLKTRLGFNNAQGDLDSFSLRKDLFGKTFDADGDRAWKAALGDCWVENLKTHPVFGRYCQPFDPMNAVEPGFAIPFRTTIAARKDLFGNDLAGGSTAYSSTYFATKLRAVGVWIEGEDAKGSLPTRPEVYLVPSGLDYMRVPIKASSTSAVAYRAWQVVDQVLPVPYSLDESDWESGDWSMLKDIFSNELCLQRRHPAIRANVGATFDESATMTYNARLIGRSVWNDEWYLFIPAASLNADDAAAKRNFLDSVKDIHLNLRTYSLSGN